MTGQYLKFFLAVVLLCCGAACSAIEESAVSTTLIDTDSKAVVIEQSATSVNDDRTFVEDALDLDKMKDLPRSEDFPVKSSDIFTGKPASPHLIEPRAKRYRTVITQAVERGPNFAGRYTIVGWGAGMGNFSMAVADAKTGRIYFPPFESVSRASYGLHFDGEPSNPAFRKESRLFAFFGCPGKEDMGCEDWSKYGLHVYSFDNGKFNLEKFVFHDISEDDKP